MILSWFFLLSQVFQITIAQTGTGCSSLQTPGSEIIVSVRNPTTQPVAIYLLDSNCQSVFYSNVQAGETFRLAAWINSAWYASSSSGLVDRFRPVSNANTEWIVGSQVNSLPSLPNMAIVSATASTLSVSSAQITSTPALCSSNERLGSNVLVTIRNSSPRPVSVFWVDSTCQQIFIAALQSSQSISQSSWLNHVFVAVDDSNNRVDTFRVGTSNTWTIENRPSLSVTSSSLPSLSLISPVPSSSSLSITVHTSTTTTAPSFDVGATNGSASRGPAEAHNSSSFPVGIIIMIVIIIFFAFAVAGFVYLLARRTISKRDLDESGSDSDAGTNSYDHVERGLKINSTNLKGYPEKLFKLSNDNRDVSHRGSILPTPQCMYGTAVNHHPSLDYSTSQSEEQHTLEKFTSSSQKMVICPLARFSMDSNQSEGSLSDVTICEESQDIGAGLNLNRGLKHGIIDEKNAGPNNSVMTILNQVDMRSEIDKQSSTSQNPLWASPSPDFNLSTPQTRFSIMEDTQSLDYDMELRRLPSTLDGYDSDHTLAEETPGETSHHRIRSLSLSLDVPRSTPLLGFEGKMNRINSLYRIPQSVVGG